MKQNIAKLIATSLGCGYSPFAPGTVGALFGVIVYLLISHFLPQLDINIALIIMIIMCTLVGTWATATTQTEWGHDASKVVIDETIGVWIAMLFIPSTMIYILLAFGLFRLFDIWKPLGIRAIDKNMHSAFSVILDDIVAGVYAATILQLIIYFKLF